MTKSFVWAILLSVLVGCDFALVDGDDDSECTAKMDKVPLDTSVAGLGGYTQDQKVHFINSDKLEFDMHVSSAEAGYDTHVCSEGAALHERKKVILEGPNPLLSMGMSVEHNDFYAATVKIIIGSYTFNFKIDDVKEACSKQYGQDSLFARVGYCVVTGGDNGGGVSRIDTLRLNGNLYKDVFKVKHSVYGSNRDNIFFSAEKGLLRFEKEDGSFIEIYEKKKRGGK
ncbi:hypothetical protein [Fibrobacter sp. UBA4309]|jgi:hypothetical protein|uniref:hypothetical protein n=1 Tax=Fibrobacter sp. UBA4309 TaxID=1946537 RepID=UPI0025B98B88|nr:hypothetical protein [Fibrobacter sp. UBA4309]